MAGCAQFIYKSDSDYGSTVLLGLASSILSPGDRPPFLKIAIEGNLCRAPSSPPRVVVYDGECGNGNGRVYGGGAMASKLLEADEPIKRIVARAFIKLFVAFSISTMTESATFEDLYASLGEGDSFAGPCASESLDSNIVDALFYVFGPSDGAEGASLKLKNKV
jgi:hypothetical protein